jgi:hypothetical protein
MEKRTEQFAACCLLSKKSPINFAELSGNRYIYVLNFKRKLNVQKKSSRRGPRQIAIFLTPLCSHCTFKVLHLVNGRKNNEIL